jgi:DNA-binding CsgD family transcriptional regulator
MLHVSNFAPQSYRPVDMPQPSQRGGPAGGAIAPEFLDTICRATFQALELAGIGIILTDRRANVRFVNSVAGGHLPTSTLRVEYGQALCVTREDTSRLHNAIMTVAAKGCTRAHCLGSHSGSAAQHVAISRLSLPCGEGDRNDSLVMLTFTPEQGNLAEESLQEVYGLTPAEARLLRALVQGEQLSAYAARAGVRISTAKTHLQSLFSKTGEKRQADLIRKALSEPSLRLRVNPAN